ncbi:metal ABC transporter substrate-binding protein [Treponema sp. R6D11]
MASCAPNPTNVSYEIIAMNNPIRSVAERLTKNTGLKISTLATSSGCLHDYSLTTEDKIKIENAKVFLTTDGFKDEENAASVSGVYSCPVGEDTEHFWVSKSCAEIFIKNVYDVLIAKFPSHQDEIKLNYDEAIAEVKQIKDTYSQEAVLSLNSGLSNMFSGEITLHQEEDENISLSPNQIKSAIELARKDKVRFVVLEKNYTPKVLETLKEEIPGLKEIRLSLMTDSNEDYIESLSNNYKIIREALGGNK